jgi:hypothetical protein
MNQKFRTFLAISFLFLMLLVFPKVESFNSLQSNNEITSVPYFDLINSSFSLTQEEIDLLNQNEFIVLNRLGTDDILDAYMYYWQKDLPIVITTDAMLHTWHLIFDNILKQTEEFILLPLITNLSKTMMDILIQEDLSKASLEMKDVATYLAVNILLNDSNAIVPVEIRNSAQKIYSAILSEISFPEAVKAFTDINTSRFVDDFTIYKPRGHYTDSEGLKHYFRIFKWLSRIPFFYNAYSGSIYLDRTPQQLVFSSVILTKILKNSLLTFNNKTINGFTVWKLFDKFLNSLVGKTYAISPLDIDYALSKIIGQNWTNEMISDQNITTLMDEINVNASIPYPKAHLLVNSYTEHPITPKTFVLFGERLTLDIYGLNAIVQSGNKLLPQGLDFAMINLNSSRAFELMNPTYIDEIHSIQNNIQEWDPAEKNTITMNWINSLSELTKNVPDSDAYYDSQNYPNFMSSNAWKDEKLTTVMGSWAQLKHDTILYSIQGSGSMTCSTPEGFVEPYPQLYKQLRKLNSMFNEVLSGFLNLTESIPFASIYAIDRFDNALNMLENISISELSGVPLTDDQRAFINKTFSLYRPMMSGPTLLDGWLSSIIKILDKKFNDAGTRPNSRASVVADIFTDPNYQSILEVATGYLENLIVKVPGFNGSDILAVGPVFSYFEFQTSVNNRMTDPEWRGILREESGYYPSDYPHSIPRGYWASSYMVSTGITNSLMYEETYDNSPPEWYKNNQKKLFNSYSDVFIYEEVTITSSENSYEDFFKINSSETIYSTQEISHQSITSPGLTFGVVIISLILIFPFTIRRRLKR